jgi:hypothetical protein
LDDPRGGRMCGAAGEMHAATAQFEEEQHVQPFQPDRIDCEEIDGEQTVSMRADELSPGRPFAGAGRSNPLRPAATCGPPSLRPSRQAPCIPRQSVDSPTGGSLGPNGPPCLECHVPLAVGRLDAHTSTVSSPADDAIAAGFRA